MIIVAPANAANEILPAARANLPERSRAKSSLDPFIIYHTQFRELPDPTRDACSQDLAAEMFEDLIPLSDIELAQQFDGHLLFDG